MNIELGNPNQMLAHILLSDVDACKVISEAHKGAGGKGVPIELVPTVFVNGVEIRAEALESALNNLFEQVKDHYHHVYEDVDRAVAERADKIVRDKLHDLMERMTDLDTCLDRLF